MWAHINCVSCAHTELQNWFSTDIAVRYSVFCSLIVSEYWNLVISGVQL